MVTQGVAGDGHGRWLPWLGPLALGVALAPLDAPLPACVLTWLLAWGVAQGWHRWLMPRWRRWAAGRGLVALPSGALGGGGLARADLASLGWYVLAWLPVGGLFVAWGLVLQGRLRARLSAGTAREEALKDLALALAPLLGVTLAGQWGVVAAFYGYLAVVL